MRRFAYVGLVLTTMMILLSGCNPYNRMQKNVGKIEACATPEVLTLKGETVEAEITYAFPPKYFYEEMIRRFTAWYDTFPQSPHPGCSGNGVRSAARHLPPLSS